MRRTLTINNSGDGYNEGLLSIGDLLVSAIKNLEERIGCGCGGDYGTCNHCEHAVATATNTIEKYNKLKETIKLS